MNFKLELPENELASCVLEIVKRITEIAMSIVGSPWQFKETKNCSYTSVLREGAVVVLLLTLTTPVNFCS